MATYNTMDKHFTNAKAKHLSETTKKRVAINNSSTTYYSGSLHAPPQCNNTGMRYTMMHENGIDRVSRNNIQHYNNTTKILEQSIISSYAYKQLVFPIISKMPMRQLKSVPRLHNSDMWNGGGSGGGDYNVNASALSNERNVICKTENAYAIQPTLDAKNSFEASKQLLELSRVPDICKDLRQSGYISLLVHMLCSESEDIICKQISMALNNIIFNHPIEKSARREIKILRLLEQIIAYCKLLKDYSPSGYEINVDNASIPILPAISSLMKISFDEEHRQSMCTLGALQIIANVLHLDYVTHAASAPSALSVNHNSFRRYALMALTNLTFGDERNKAILCRQRPFMETLVAQLATAPDDLLQVTASLLRNLSWRADNNMKIVLNEIGTVTALVHAAMKNRNENTLKSILSALWNLSAHCSKNKAEFCAVNGALAFLVCMLTYKSPSKTLKIVENAGGILRNVSSHIAVREDYRQILRRGNCLLILLQHLKSESLTVVSNSCGSLWNLSARCHEDQQFLWNNGAVAMLRSLVQSKHAMIAEGSSAALKNLLNFRAAVQNANSSTCLKKIPIVTAKKPTSRKECLHKVCFNSIRTNENLKYFGPNVKALHQNSRSKSLDSLAPRPTDLIYEKCKYYMPKYKSCSLDCFPDLAKNHARLEKYDDITQSYNYAILPSDISELGMLASSDEKQFESSIDEPSYASSYQETDLDQLTNFSLRYAENQIEAEIDVVTSMAPSTSHFDPPSEDLNARKLSKGSEIVLILEDSVKCYQTEDTPYMTSNATSVNDLTNNKAEPTSTHQQVPPASKFPRQRKYKKSTKQKASTSYGSGFDTPENPISYCEEGTPDVFSRHESLNSLVDVSHTPNTTKPTKTKTSYYPEDNQIQKKSDCTCNLVESIAEKTHGDVAPAVHLNKTHTNSAQETPLMFSRRSSLDSLREVDVTTFDDISSIQSDFSRLASGVISPDIPDSPTQIVARHPPTKLSVDKPIDYSNSYNGRKDIIDIEPNPSKPLILNNVFEDNVSTFNVENTPAQFSSATSLSNLSSVEEENTQINYQSKQPVCVPQNISEGEEEDTHTNYDEILLASCIDIGMNRVSNSGLSKNDMDNRAQVTRDEIKEYYTEDTPALFSNQGSNTNLSAISIVSSKNELSVENLPIRLTDDDATNDVIDLPQPDIQLPTGKKDDIDDTEANFPSVSVAPSTRHVETTPTVNCSEFLESTTAKVENCLDPDYKYMNNSLSSLSIDSDDDNHLLSQTIAAGYNRPKSNLGFIRLDANKHSNSLSTSQPIDRSRMRPSTHSNEKQANRTFDAYGSSNESSDSDNQSKSLLELCIRTGMHKSQSFNNVKQKNHRKYRNDQINAQLVFAAHSNPNLAPLQKTKKSSKAKKEQKLLMDCINAGITTKTGTSTTASTGIVEHARTSKRKSMKLPKSYDK